MLALINCRICFLDSGLEGYVGVGRRAPDQFSLNSDEVGTLE